MLKILAHYLFSHAILWDIFLYQSDANYLLNVDFAFLHIHIRAGVSLLSSGSQIFFFSIVFKNSVDNTLKYFNQYKKNESKKMNIRCTYNSILFKLQRKRRVNKTHFYFLFIDISVAFNNENKKMYPN